MIQNYFKTIVLIISLFFVNVFYAQYCTPTVPVSTTSYLNNLKISSTKAGGGDLLNYTSTNVGYQNIVDSEVTLTSSTAYTFNFGIGDPALTSHKRVHVWIDMNRDGDFDDAGELMFSWSGANTTADLKFSDKNIGVVHVAGESKMRVAMIAADAAIDPINPCDDFTGGEVQDYKINLKTPDATSCEPISMSASTTSFINYFKIDGGGLLNHTSGNVGYENNTDSDVPLVAEAAYKFNFGIGNPGSASNKRVHIWIDKNQNGNFTDAGEEVLVWTGANTSGDLAFTNKVIGAFPMLGATTMRIAMRSSNSAIQAIGPCDSFTDGEIEDYSVIISEPIAPLATLTPEIDLDLFIGDQIPFTTNGTPHTYRIPSLVTSNAGTLLAITDARYQDASDVPGVIDMFVRRSTDNGETWGDAITIKTDHGGDPCTVVDKTTGRIFVFYAYSEHQSIFGSNGDPSSPNTLRSQYKYSDDDGLTWSAAVDLTASLYRAGEKSFWASAGTGIQLRNGTLVVPIAIVKSNNQIFGGLLYSSDNGDTWNRSQNDSFVSFDENTIVELNDGSIMVNSRNHYGTGTRLVTYTDDLGVNWTPYTFDATLIDPVSQGNILRYTTTLDGYDKDRILFSNSGNKGSRIDGTLRVSYDEGQTWEHSKIYQTGSSAYSSMAILPDGKIGVLYETDGYKKIRFRRFSLDDLSDSNDTFVALSITEVGSSNNGTRLYPNPVNHIVNITASIKSEVKIYTIIGKLILVQDVHAENKEIDLSSLKKGLYIVKIKNELGTKNFEIIKK